MADDKVVQFRPKPEPEPDPHITGKAHCLACKHEWVTVAPAGTWEFECPSCGLLRGVVTTHIHPPDEEPVFVHHCGCFVFVLSKTMGTICIGCGEAVDWSNV